MRLSELQACVGAREHRAGRGVQRLHAPQVEHDVADGAGQPLDGGRDAIGGAEEEGALELDDGHRLHRLRRAAA